MTDSVIVVDPIYYGVCNCNQLAELIQLRYYQQKQYRLDQVFRPEDGQCEDRPVSKVDLGWTCEVCTFINKSPSLASASPGSNAPKKPRRLPEVEARRVCEMCGSLSENTHQPCRNEESISSLTFTKISSCSVVSTAPYRTAAVLDAGEESVYKPTVVTVHAKRCYMNVAKGNTTRPKFVCNNDETMYVEPFIINTFQHPELYENDRPASLAQEQELAQEHSQDQTTYYCSLFHELTRGKQSGCTCLLFYN